MITRSRNLVEDEGVTGDSSSCLYGEGGRAFLSPDSEALKKMGPVDYLNHAENLIDRITAGVRSLEEVKTRWLKAYLNNLGSRECLVALASEGIKSKVDMRKAVILCHENHGSVVDDSWNVAKFFTKKPESESYQRPLYDKTIIVIVWANTLLTLIIQKKNPGSVWSPQAQCSHYFLA